MKTLLSILVCASASIASAERVPESPDQRVAIALVVEANELWMGAQPDPGWEDWRGYYDQLASSLDHLGLEQRAPAGSEGLIIGYASGTRILMPRGPLGRMRSIALGQRADYTGEVGTELVEAVNLALDQLAASKAEARVLVVIGGGHDTNLDSNSGLGRAKQRADQLGVETYALIAKSPVSPEGQQITTLAPSARTIVSAAELEPELTALVEQAMRPRALIAPPVAPATVAEKPAAAPAPTPLLGWWQQLALGAALVGALALIARTRAAHQS